MSVQKKYTPMIIAAILFFTFGLMLLLQGIEDKGKGVQVTAIIEDIQLRTGSSSDDGSDTHDIYVNYTYGDKDYERVGWWNYKYKGK